MIAARSFAAPVRQQCLRASTRAWAPVSVPARRQYAQDFSPKQEVAKFHGQKGSDGLYTVSLIEGDGIGPEIAQSVKDIFSAAKVRITEQEKKR
jgi:isocitrate dehydrogenase (NAD+)